MPKESREPKESHETLGARPLPRASCVKESLEDVELDEL